MLPNPTVINMMLKHEPTSRLFREAFYPATAHYFILSRAVGYQGPWLMLAQVEAIETRPRSWPCVPVVIKDQVQGPSHRETPHRGGAETPVTLIL
jgi:hypothetical protein